jgi:hypothetical protein
MTKLTLTKPEVGGKNTTEEPKVGNALTAIEQWANGEIDTTNLKNGGVEEVDLSAAVQTLLNQKSSGLSVVSHAVSVTAASGELALMTKTGTTLELPAPTLNANVGVYYAETAGSITVKASSGAIAGDFIASATSVKLLPNQHVLLTADGSAWRIMAGEPKREAAYEAKTITLAEAEAGVIPSATRSALVTLSAKRVGTGGYVTLAPTVGGTGVGLSSCYVGAEAIAPQASLTFETLPGETWKATMAVSSGSATLNVATRLR